MVGPWFGKYEVQISVHLSDIVIFAIRGFTQHSFITRIHINHAAETHSSLTISWDSTEFNNLHPNPFLFIPLRSVIRLEFLMQFVVCGLFIDAF
jgi:hypothetical protein